MLTAIKIKNFRLFESLEVKRLGRVTLLVGKNNSGKSSFLEALLLYLNKPDFLILHDLISCRQGHVMHHMREYSLFKGPVRHIFYNHCVPKVDEPGISILSNANKKDGLQVFTTDTKKEVSGSPLLVLTGKKDAQEGIIWSADQEIEHRKHFGNIGASGHLKGGTLFANLSSEKFQFIQTTGLPDWVAANIWDQVLLTDIESVVLDTLKIIEPKLEKIIFLSFSRGDVVERVPQAKVKGMSGSVGLRSLGDGVTRLFHILIAIANAKDGTLLIDEFENGFHWSVQEKVWTAVFELAEKLNVQVFATTHSRDCVQAFSKVWTENEEAGAFIRLENNEGVVRAQEYNSRSLARSIRAEVEVR